MTAFFSFLLGHVHGWAGKMVLIGVLLALWQLFVAPYAVPIKILGLYYLNISFHQILSYEVFQTIWQIVLMFATYKMMKWILFPSDNSSTLQSH